MNCRRFGVIACFVLIGTVLTMGPISYEELYAWSTSLIPESFSDLAEKVSPAVVNIRTVKTTKGGGRVFRHFQSPFGDNEPFNEFFDKFFGDDQTRDFKQRSLGSGFIIDQEGHIVTNNHVIEDADEIQVRLNDGKEFDAEIVGRDPNTDIALIKIKSPKTDLPTIKLGNSDEIRVGDWVVAIGNPFGLEHTVTAGIVSAKGRVIGAGPYDDFIQTDASINPGNSGGPLLNLKGEVVGINTAIVASGQGIGFAVPLKLAKGIIEQLKDSGEVTRGWLGVAIQDMNEELAEYYGVKEKAGVFITEVFPGDPADEAGIKSKDIITEVNGEKVITSRELTRLIANTPVGKKARITVIRDGKEKYFDVKIGKRDDGRLSKMDDKSRGGEKEDELGIRVSQLTPEIARRFNIDDQEGVIVSGVESGSKGDKAGVLVGDILKEVNHQAIKNIDDYRESIRKVKAGDTIQIFVKRPNAGFVVIKLTR